MIRGSIEPAGPEPPKGVRLRGLLDRNRRLYVRFTRFLGERFTGSIVPELCGELRRAFRLSLDDESLIRCSLEELLPPGQPLTKQTIKGVLLKFDWCAPLYFPEGRYIPRWTGDPPVWAAVKIEDLTNVRIRNKMFAELRIHSLAGATAGETHDVVLPIKYVRWLVKEMGFPRYEKAHERDVVGMVCWARLETTRYGRVSVGVVKPTGGQLDANRKLAKARLNKNCARRTVCCVTCPLGMDRCPLATRRSTLDKEKEDGESSSS